MKKAKQGSYVHHLKIRCHTSLNELCYVNTAVATDIVPRYITTEFNCKFDTNSIRIISSKTV